MKKILSLSVALVLVLLLPFSALGETDFADASTEDKLVMIRNLVRSFLDRYEVKYKYDVDYDSFDFSLSVDNSYGSVEMSVFVYDDSVVSCGYLPFVFKDANEKDTAHLLALLNESMFYGNFIMSKEYKTIYARCFQHIDSVLPGDKELESIIILPSTYVEKYGESISAVAIHGQDPAEVYKKIRNSDEEVSGFLAVPSILGQHW